MRKTIYSSAAQAGVAIAKEISELLNKKPDAVLCLASGNSSLPVFEALRISNADFSQVRFVQLDEWVGLDPGAQGSCVWFLDNHFFRYRKDISGKQIYYFDAHAGDLENECGRMEQIIKELGGIDYILLGMGMNGHLALNEPGCDFASGVHITELAEETKAVSVKYFFDNAPTLTSGITLGIRNILDCRKICLCVFGDHKREVVLTLNTNMVSNDFPASVLKTAHHASLVLDEDAAECATP